MFFCRGFTHSFTSALRCLALTELRAHPFFLRADFRRERGTEILRFEDLTNFDFGAAIERCPLEPLDGFLFRVHLPQPKASNQLLGFRKWSIGYDPVLSRKLHARALGTRVESFACKHDA